MMLDLNQYNVLNRVLQSKMERARHAVTAMTLVLGILVGDIQHARASTAGIDPPNHYSEQETNLYWAGAVALIGRNFCGYYEKGDKLWQAIKHLKPVQAAYQKLIRFDKYNGNCAEIGGLLDDFADAFGNYSAGETSDKEICKFAVDQTGDTPSWETDNVYKSYVDTAKHRGLTPAQCLEIQAD